MLTGVVVSQVIAPARAYTAAFPSLEPRIVFLEPARIAIGRRARRRLAALRELWPAARMSLCPYVGRLGEHAPARSLELMLRLSPPRDGLLLHCRGPEATIHGRRAARRYGARVVFDARGASGPEARLRTQFFHENPDEGMLERVYNRGLGFDKRAAEAADAISTISEPLRIDLARHGTNGKPFGVIPCCVDAPLFDGEARDEVRGALGVGDDELLFVHVSTEARWEAFDQVYDFFREVSSRRPSKLLFLTMLDEATIVREIGLEALSSGVLVRSVPPHEVKRYLSASDVGLLLRRPHETHRVASPIKFAEYLGAGLAIVVSAGIGETAEVVEGERVGVVLDASRSDAGVEQAARRLVALLEERDGVRERAIAVCRDRFVWERYLPVIADLYGLTPPRVATALRTS
jgi:glycosyltransferase involved in cell wall biosynthesis